MMQKRRFKVLVLALILIAGIFWLTQQCLQAQEQPLDTGSADKVEQLLAGQKQILQQLDAIRQQLDAIQRSTNKL